MTDIMREAIPVVAALALVLIAVVVLYDFVWHITRRGDD